MQNKDNNAISTTSDAATFQHHRPANRFTFALLRTYMMSFDFSPCALRRITLQNVRNITFADLNLDGRLQFLVGGNGQGKTNLLEAAGFVTALRSFRTTDARVLIRQGQSEAAIACEFDHEQLGPTRLLIKLRTDGKEVWSDGERTSRLSDHLERFPTVVFSSQDQQLIRGAPTLRRRWLGLTLSATDPGYLRALQAYHQALTASIRTTAPGVPPRHPSRSPR